MAGEFGAPYRAPCGGWPAAPKLVIPSHIIQAHRELHKWNNTTKRSDNNQAPAPRLNDGQASGAGYPACAGNPPICNPGECGKWRQGLTDEPLHAPSCDTPGSDRATVDFNCYEKSNPKEVIDESVCKKIGFKNVQAFKAWHGRFGPMSNFWEPATSMTAAVDYPLDVVVRAPKCSPQDQTKYLTVTSDVSITKTVVATNAVTTGGATSTCSVSRTSGIKTGSLTLAGGAHDAEAVARMTGLGLATLRTLEAFFSTRCEEFTARDPSYLNTTWGTGATGTPWINYSVPHDPENSIIGVEHRVDLNLASGSLTEVYEMEGGESYTEEFVCSGTSVAYTRSASAIDAEAGELTIEETCTITYADPYTATQNWEDVCELLNTWNLSDDALYPWRRDEYGTIAPLVVRDEVPGAIAPVIITQEDYTDPDAAIYGGTIVGSPLPLGFDSHFSWHHTTWKNCEIEAGQLAWYPYSYGAYSSRIQEYAPDHTDSVVPRAATHWTENRAPLLDHSELSAGAWVWNIANYGLFAQKWVEALLPWPSINLNRPCGVDRGILDSSASECVESLSAEGDLILSSGVQISTNDICFYNGSIYKVTKLGEGEYRLNEPLCVAPSWINSTAAPQPPPEEKLCKLRWFFAKPVCRSVSVTAAIDNHDGTVTIMTDRDVYLMGTAEEKLTFTGVAGLVADTAVHSVVDLREFKVSGSLSGYYTEGGTLGDAALDKWNDDNPKRDFIVRVWDDTGLTETSDCMMPKPCCPSVMAFLPSGSPEIWVNNNAKTYEMTVPNMSICENHRWCADFLQVIPDPFWSEPPAPACVDPEIGLCVRWYEDGSSHADDDTYGMCREDYTMLVQPWCEVKYFPKRPHVEPILALPEGAPPLVSGVAITTSASGPMTSGHTAGEEEPWPIPSAWGIWLAIFGTLVPDSTCRFKEPYQKWFRKCC